MREYSSNNDPKQQFHDAMVQVYLRAKSECGYNATRFLQMVNEHGGYETACLLLHASNVSDGYNALWEHGRLDLSVEALIISERWSSVFTTEELQIARDRLAQYNYEPDSRSAR